MAAHPTHYEFLIAPNFSLGAFAMAVEPLRIANLVSEKEVFTWRVVSETGAPVTCSAGTAVSVDGGMEEVQRGAAIIVCTGIDARRAATKPILTWLRRESRRGVAIGAVCTGAHTVAAAGLLDNRSCTIHWEQRDGFAEEFEEVELLNQVFVVDGDRMTAAGGAAAADMMLSIVTEVAGQEVGRMVADQMVLSSMRTDQDMQRLSVPARIGVRHPKLAQVINMMEENIEEPVSAAALASAVAMSTRQLERLFRRYLDRSPKRYYLELRLEKARRLLLQTEMSVINVALACGFTSPSHFSKCYRNRYSRTPYRERGVAAAAASA